MDLVAFTNYKTINRLTFEYDSLQKVEADQRLTIEKLSNNESWAKNNCFKA